MNEQSKALISQALETYSINATPSGNYASNYGAVACGTFNGWYPWASPSVYYSFSTDKEAQLKAIKALLKLKIDDSDKVEAIEAILK